MLDNEIKNIPDIREGKVLEVKKKLDENYYETHKKEVLDGLLEKLLKK